MNNSCQIRSYFSGWIFVLLISTYSVVFAQSSPSGGDVKATMEGRKTAEIRITLNDIAKLVDEHPQIGAGRHEIAAAHAAVNTAGMAPNPELEAIAAYGQAIDKSASRFEWGLALSMPLDWVARRGVQMEAARSEVTLAEAEAEVLRRDVLLQLRALFWRLVDAQERVSALSQINSQTQVLLETVERRVEMGEVRPVEATRIRVEADRIGGELEVANTMLVGRRAQLKAWLVGSSKGQIVAVADLEALPTPMSAEVVISAVQKWHPVMVAEKARVQALAADIEVERRERMPELSVDVFTDHELDRRAYGGGLSVGLPLWNWNRGAIQRSKSLLAAGKKRLEASRLDLEMTAIEAQSTCQAGVTLAARYRDRILPNAASASKAIERTYELGEATLLEVIDARRTLVETKGAFLDALVQAQTDCSRLRVLVGKE